MKVTVIFLLVTAIIFPVVAQAKGDRVTPRTKRVNLLKNATAALDVKNEAILAEIADVRYPFEFAPEPDKPVVVKKDEPAAPVIQKELTDAEMLAKIAPSIKPSGVFFKGGKGVLVVPGAQLPDGSSIRATFGDKAVMVRIRDVTAESYKLQLNDAVLLRKFDDTAGRGVTIDR
ncbi:MAG: hypothetical protein ACQKBV_08035 [Puniceicoccales bacterium]